MPIRSMTGFAQVKGHIAAPQTNENLNQGLADRSLENHDAKSRGGAGFILTLKAVNHRFLDLHFRMPSNCEPLEMKLRSLLKAKLARGHIELTLNVERNGNEGVLSLNRTLVGGYIRAFRAAAAEFGLAAEPDLNTILRSPGALDASPQPDPAELEPSVLAKVEEIVGLLNQMREEEGRGIESELRQLMQQIQDSCKSADKHRKGVAQAYAEKLGSRIQELIGAQMNSERILQEAALLVDRSDIQEELVRLDTHVKHFLGLLDQGGEVGKKLDFLLQEMNREANTLLSKTSGLAGEALNVTSTGLALKTDIEKAREQVQNVE